MADSGRPQPSAGPLEPDEIDALFAGWSGYPCIALAVSGGADSTALMVLAQDWARRAPSPPLLTVLTVDHGLRPESAEEADAVRRLAGQIGLPHHVLAWTGPKPRSGLQAAARAARYGLLLDVCRNGGIDALATAHTAEDQAETLLMRLARGSGLDGLAAISPVSERGGVTLLRPLLAIPRARLKASLSARGVSWIEDPSNRDARYERVRVREALGAEKGLHLAPEKLSLSARRLDRAQLALDAITAGFVQAALTVYPAGYGEMSLGVLREMPDEIAIRAVALLASLFGGGQRPVRLARIEALCAALMDTPVQTATLGGCLFTPRGSTLRIMREFGRIDPTRRPLPESGQLLWDGRFAILAPAGAGLTVGPLGPRGMAAIRANEGRIGLPAQIAHALPALWREDGLVFAPFAEFAQGRPQDWQETARAVFVGAAKLSDQSRAKAPALTETAQKRIKSLHQA